MTIIKEYEQARRQRNNYPLRTGIYKLEETRRRLSSTLHDAKLIANGLELGIHGGLYHCMPEEAEQWLNKTPQYIAHQLGYNIYPAICALGGDGVPHKAVNEIVLIYTLKINNLAQQCCTRRSHTLLLERAIDICTHVLEEAEQQSMYATGS